MGWLRRAAALAALLLASLVPASAQAPARLALVIGNAAYQTPGWALVNPVNDATLIATRLRGLGFQVSSLNNATKVQMEASMALFIARVRAGGDEAVGVFYYAGHAAEHDGANLLVPVDVTASTMDELRYQAPPLNFVLRDMARAGNKVNIVILDACRNLPLPSGTRAGAAGGLSTLDDVPTNVLLAYATRAGATAPDNPSERNSVFTRTLAEVLASNASDPLSLLFETVQSRVAASTGFSQRPEFRNQLLRAPGFRLASARVTPAVDPEVERRLRERIATLEATQKVMPPSAATGQGLVGARTGQGALVYDFTRIRDQCLSCSRATAELQRLIDARKAATTSGSGSDQEELVSLISASEADLDDRIGEAVDKVLASLIAERGFDTAIERTFMSKGSPNLDVTRDVVDRLNAEQSRFCVELLPPYASTAPRRCPTNRSRQFAAKVNSLPANALVIDFTSLYSGIPAWDQMKQPLREFSESELRRAGSSPADQLRARRTISETTARINNAMVAQLDAVVGSVMVERGKTLLLDRSQVSSSGGNQSSDITQEVIRRGSAVVTPVTIAPNGAIITPR